MMMKALGNKQNQNVNLFVSRYLVSLSRFLTKTAKISHYSQYLHSLFTELWDAIFTSLLLVLAKELTMW